MVDLRVVPLSSHGDAVDHGAPRIRVVLAEHHALLRRSLRQVLEQEGIEVIAEAADHASTKRLVVDRRPEVVVLHLGMPGGSGMEAVGALHEQAPDTGIVIVTMQDSPSFARAALARGALGFVLKELADSELGAAVRAVARGERYVSPRMRVAVSGIA